MGVSSIRATGWAQSFPIAQGPRAGRLWTRRHLDTLGWNEWAPDVADAVLLTVSELVTNAHLHAHSDAQLVLVWDNRCLQVSVHDSSTSVPSPRAADPDSTGGRGMTLVDALADTWSTHRQTNGKTVTACFHGPVPITCDPVCPPTGAKD